MLRKRNAHKNNVTRRFAGAKAQSAMEYLMTYGWAILIIAVVLGALFQLGVFNASNFAPKAPPGSCQVFRPNGPGTTSYINLKGICSGELPQYVKYTSHNSFIVANIAPLNNASAYTLTMWVDMLQNKLQYGPVLYSEGDPYTQLQIGISASNTLYVQLWNSSTNSWIGVYPPEVVPFDSWVFLAVSYSNNPNSANGIVTLYVNTQSASGTFRKENAYSYESGIGINIGYYTEGRGSYQSFDGYISNVQIYNTSLSSSGIQALYQEGIGGAPIDLQHLVAWWPLNGNANDYSGNGNNGQIIGNVIFVSNWWSGYTPP